MQSESKEKTAETSVLKSLMLKPKDKLFVKKVIFEEKPLFISSRVYIIKTNLSSRLPSLSEIIRLGTESSKT